MTGRCLLNIKNWFIHVVILNIFYGKILRTLVQKLAQKFAAYQSNVARILHTTSVAYKRSRFEPHASMQVAFRIQLSEPMGTNPRKNYHKYSDTILNWIYKWVPHLPWRPWQKWTQMSSVSTWTITHRWSGYPREYKAMCRK